MLRELQKKIDETQYWDLEILDFQINFFGDEVNIFMPGLLGGSLTMMWWVVK